MAGNVSDEAFARTVNGMGAATLAQIEAAQAAQTERAKQGILVPLAEVLVEQGVLTLALRENIENRVQAEQQGGLRQLGQYKLIKKLGEGGMGAVYLAEDVNLGRLVAVKVLPKNHAGDPEFLTRFRREAKAVGVLNHVNIAGGHTMGEDQGFHFIAMEYCEGEPLDKPLKHGGALPWDKALEIVSQVARGLEHAHEHGIIHRDIKPGNIILTPEGVAKILDLGLSKTVGGEEHMFQTETGVVLGTAHYISPEQANGDKNVDRRTDIYSLGATFYHLVTGKTPFQAATPMAMILKHIHEQLPNPQDICDEIPDGVVQIIQKMMAKAPADRYRDCKELLADLELVIDGKMPSSQAIAEHKSSVAVARAARPKKPAGIAQVPRRAAGPVTPVGKQGPERVGRRKTAPDGAVAQPGGAQPGWSSKAIGVAAAAAVLAVVAVVVAVVLVSNSNRRARAEQEAREKSKKEEALQQAEKAKRQAEEERERAAKAEKEKRMLEDQLREARLATAAAKKKAEAIGEKAEQKPVTPTVPATTVQAEPKPAPPAAPAPTTKPQPAAVPAEKASGADVALAYETALAEAYGLLGQFKVQEAEKRLDQAKADPKLEALRQALELDKKCAHMMEDWNKADAAGAALLGKDSRAFTLRYADGKPPYKVGQGSRNRVKGVSGEIIETEMDLGGGFAGKKVPLDALAPQTRCELAALALPPEAQTDLHLGFAGLLALQCRAEGFTADTVRKRLEAARKKGAPADIVNHIGERLEACEREQQALAVLKQIDDVLKAKELQDARTLFDKAKQDHAGTLALARAQGGIEDRLAELAPPTYLADLPELEVKTCQGLLDFGKGRFKEGPELKLNGKSYPHGLALHPPHDGSGHVAYMLDKRYRSFQATAAICDTGGAGPDGLTGRPLTFRAVGDGKELWKSQPLQRRSQSEECKVDVSGVSKLELLVDCRGGAADGAHSAWLDALVRGSATGPPMEIALDLGGAVKVEMLLIPAGTFLMGSPENEVGREGDGREGPQHKVTITKPFYMGKYDVTVAQFRAFADATKQTTEAEQAGEAWTCKDGGLLAGKGVNWRTPGYSQEDNYPACAITWNDAQEFCKWATQQTGRKVCLPTEAQWEYACRAGTTTRFNSGNKDSDLEQAAWSNMNSGLHINACGQKKPNAWGLYDMHGNVWQWVQDYYSDKYSIDPPPVDPKGPASGGDRVLRGGCWGNHPDGCRAAYRLRNNPGFRCTIYGFRCAVDF